MLINTNVTILALTCAQVPHCNGRAARRFFFTGVRDMGIACTSAATALKMLHSHNARAPTRGA